MAMFGQIESAQVESVGTGALDQGQTMTCYAYSIAMVIAQAAERADKGIMGTTKEDKRQKIEGLVKSIIQRCRQGDTSKGYNVEAALKMLLPELNMRYEANISESQARQAIMEGRYVLGCFFITKAQFQNFQRFFHFNKAGVLTKKELNANNAHLIGDRDVGHAVVIDRCHGVTHQKCLRIKNSWGPNKGNAGYLFVEDKETLGMILFDVRNVPYTHAQLEAYRREQGLPSPYPGANLWGQQQPIPQPSPSPYGQQPNPYLAPTPSPWGQQPNPYLAPTPSPWGQQYIPPQQYQPYGYGNPSGYYSGASPYRQ